MTLCVCVCACVYVRHVQNHGYGSFKGCDHADQLVWTKCFMYCRPTMPGNMDVMTWFPRREDYEVPPAAAVDESTHEKVDRLNEIIENNQTNIKEIVDGDNVSYSSHFTA